MTEAGTPAPAHEERAGTIWAIAVFISAFIILFLVWLIYFQEPGEQAAGAGSILPVLNSCFNALSAACVAAGVVFIKRGRIRPHALCMIGATLASTAFLVGYLIYHYGYEHTVFSGPPAVRAIYLFILITHIILAAAVVPFVLVTLLQAARRQWNSHKRVARWTYPVWLYVSITGIVVFFFLRLFNAA